MRCGAPPDAAGTADTADTADAAGMPTRPTRPTRHHRVVPSVVIADPSLVVLVGAAGSGKSTLAARLFAPEEILSSDAFRATLSGDEADQRVSRLAFQLLHRSLAARLGSGRLAVVDATNATPDHRRSLLRLARAAGVGAAAIVLDLPIGSILDQNAGRSRVVDDDVIDRHHRGVRRSVDAGQLVAEGFDPIIVLRSRAEAATLVVQRRPAPGPTARER
jgi:predicted kinase